MLSIRGNLVVRCRFMERQNFRWLGFSVLGRVKLMYLFLASKIVASSQPATFLDRTQSSGFPDRLAFLCHLLFLFKYALTPCGNHGLLACVPIASFVRHTYLISLTLFQSRLRFRKMLLRTCFTLEQIQTPAF